MNVSARIALALGIALGIAADGSAQEWTRFRGPNGTGAADSKAIPTTWSESDFKWRVEIPGKSHSQPVIWEDKIFLESALDDGKERLLICLQKADGRELWSKKMALPTHVPGNKNSGYANSSPAV